MIGDVPDPHVGRVLRERFVLEGLLGSGAMGHVYRAHDRQRGEPVAVKILRPELMSDWSLIKRFHREARAAEAIESPHVVRIHDFGEAGEDVLYIAMELVAGESVATRIERVGALPPVQALRIARAVAAALESAHAAGVIHRDLKPDNVMLPEDGGVKVVDFGIARILEGSEAASEIVSHLTVAGSIMGTPLYISPEAAARRPVGPPADLYALGVMLFEMLTGEPPFVDDNPMALIGMHLRVPPPTLAEAAPTLDAPAALGEVLDGMLAKSPAVRLDAPGALALLTRALAEVEAAAAPEGEIAPDTLEDTPFSSIAATLADTVPQRAAGPEHMAATHLLVPSQGPAREAPVAEDAAATLISPPPASEEQAIRQPLVPLALVGTAVFAVIAAIGLLVAVGTDEHGTDALPAAEPRRPGAPTRPATAAAATEAPDPAGFVTVRSDRPCTVSIDGEVLGLAPVERLRVAPGTHLIRCVPPQGGDGASARVAVEPGAHVERSLELSE